MLSLKAHFGRFSLLVVFVCLSTEFLLAIDSFPVRSCDNEKKDFMYKYNEYAYLDDEPLDIALEVAACEPPQKNRCESHSDKSQVHHCDCRAYESQADCCQCRRCKSQRYNQGGLSIGGIGAFTGLSYVIYKERNIIKVAIIGTAFFIILKECNFWINRVWSLFPSWF